MAILRIHIELERTRKVRDYELSVNFVNPGAQLGDLYEVYCPYLIHIGDSMVFRGHLKINGKQVDGEVACKMVEGDASALEAEARFYTTTLKDVQHDLVPQFILYATAILPVSKIPYACMMTKYEGKTFTGDWVDNPIEDRFNAFLTICKLHRLGVLHGDFEPSNVVVDENGHVRIIDFGHATLHNCHVVDRVYHLYENEPSPVGDLRCSEVYDTALMMDIWTPRLLTFKGLAINMTQVKTVEDLAHIGFKYYPLTSPDEIRQQAADFMQDYHDHYIVRREQAEEKHMDPQAAAASDESSQGSAAGGGTLSATSC